MAIEMDHGKGKIGKSNLGLAKSTSNQKESHQNLDLSCKKKQAEHLLSSSEEIRRRATGKDLHPASNNIFTEDEHNLPAIITTSPPTRTPATALPEPH